MANSPDEPSHTGGGHPPAGSPTNQQEMEAVEIDKEGEAWADIKKTSLEQENSDGVDEAEKAERPGPPAHAGFWHHSMVNIRLHVLKLWTRTGKLLDAWIQARCYPWNCLDELTGTCEIVLILFIAVMLVLSLFEGVFNNIPANYKALIVYVVDFDGQVAPYLGGTPVIGPQIVRATETIVRTQKEHLGYVTMPPSMFNNDPMAVREAVYDFKAHAAIIINANATALLRQAVEQGNSSYDPNGAAQIIYVTARDQNTIPTYVVPPLTGLQKNLVASIGSSWARSVLQNSTLSPQNLANVPQAISPAIGFTTIDLRPYGPPGMTPWVSIGLIYLIIIAFFSFSFFLPIHLKYIQPKGHPPLHFYQLIIWRWCAAVAAYFLLSLCYSFVPLAFQIPFNNPPASHTEPAINPNAYGKGTFVVYWMLNFIGMTALGLACENVAMLAGQPWTAIWLIFWVITNVSTGFYSMDLSPGFYAWGYAWPLHNIVEASHQILFDLHSRIGLNFAVLLVWAVINSVLFPGACYIMRWKGERERRLKEEKEKEWLQAMSRQRTNLGLPK